MKSPSLSLFFLLWLAVTHLRHEAAAGPSVRLRQHMPIPRGKPANLSQLGRGRIRCLPAEEERRLVAAAVLFSISGLGVLANVALALLILGNKSLRRFVVSQHASVCREFCVCAARSGRMEWLLLCF